MLMLDLASDGWRPGGCAFHNPNPIMCRFVLFRCLPSYVSSPTAILYPSSPSIINLSISASHTLRPTETENIQPGCGFISKHVSRPSAAPLLFSFPICKLTTNHFKIQKKKTARVFPDTILTTSSSVFLPTVGRQGPSSSLFGGELPKQSSRLLFHYTRPQRPH